MNQVMKIFWEVWRNAQPFKNQVMKTIYIALNKDRPNFMQEIIINSLEQKGPAP
jgi:hypothetical protein